MQHDHFPEVALGDGVDCGKTESRRKHPVVGRRGPSPLDVADLNHAHVVAGALFDEWCNGRTDATQAVAAELILGVNHVGLCSRYRSRTFGDHDD